MRESTLAARRGTWTYVAVLSGVSLKFRSFALRDGLAFTMSEPGLAAIMDHLPLRTTAMLSPNVIFDKLAGWQSRPVMIVVGATAPTEAEGMAPHVHGQFNCALTAMRLLHEGPVAINNYAGWSNDRMSETFERRQRDDQDIVLRMFLGDCCRSEGSEDPRGCCTGLGWIISPPRIAGVGAHFSFTKADTKLLPDVYSQLRSNRIPIHVRSAIGYFDASYDYRQFSTAPGLPTTQGDFMGESQVLTTLWASLEALFTKRSEKYSSDLIRARASNFVPLPPDILRESWDLRCEIVHGSYRRKLKEDPLRGSKAIEVCRNTEAALRLSLRRAIDEPDSLVEIRRALKKG